MSFLFLFLGSAVCVWMFSHVFCLRPYGLQPTGLLCPWDSPGKHTGMGCIGEGNGSSQPRNWTLISCVGRQILYHWAPWDAPLGSLDRHLVSMTNKYSKQENIKCLHSHNIPLPWGSASTPWYNPWPCVSVPTTGLWFFCHDSTYALHHFCK